MSRKAARVTQADIARALRAVAQSGSPMVVEITPDGTIRIVPHNTSNEQEEAIEDGHRDNIVL